MPATCRPAAESRPVSPGWQPSWSPIPDRWASAMIRSVGTIPPHFESRTLKQVGRPPLDRSDRVGIAAERLVEHHRHAESGTELGQRIDLGVGHRLLQGRGGRRPGAAGPVRPRSTAGQASLASSRMSIRRPRMRRSLASRAGSSWPSTPTFTLTCPKP